MSIKHSYAKMPDTCNLRVPCRSDLMLYELSCFTLIAGVTNGWFLFLDCYACRFKETVMTLSYRSVLVCLSTHVGP